jgi:hypothetical protein
MQICGLSSFGFLFGLLLLAAVIEGATRLLLDDIVGWSVSPDAPAEIVAGFERRHQLVASVLSIVLGIAACWIFGIGILQWLNLGVPNVPPEQARVLDYVFTGLVIGGGTRAVAAILRSVGLLPSLPFERKKAVPRQTSTSVPTEAQPSEMSTGVVARLIEVASLPGIFWKTLQVPPNHVGVIYAGEVGAQVLQPGQHTVRWLGAREPTLIALIDTSEFTLIPISRRLTSADGELVDWVFKVKARVADPLRFATRTLDHQPLVDQRNLANLLVADLTPAIQAEVDDYDAGTLFDSPAAHTNIVRRLVPHLHDICADHGLEEKDFASVSFAPALDEVQALDHLEGLTGESGRKEIEKTFEANPEPEQAIKMLETKTGTPRLFTPDEETQIKQDAAKPGGLARIVNLLGRAVERKMSEVRQRVEDQIEQVLVRERRPATKMDKFLQRNARLLAWATRLKLLGGAIVSAITVLGILRPELLPKETVSTAQILGASLGLLTAVGAFVASLWLDAEYHRRKEDFERGWLNRLSAERVLEADALQRTRVVTELQKIGDELREARNRIVYQRKETAIQMKEIEEKANRFRQEVEGAETGHLQLVSGNRVSAQQAQRLGDLGAGLSRDAEKLTQRGMTLNELVQKSDWDGVDAVVATFDRVLTDLRNRFSNRATILRGTA